MDLKKTLKSVKNFFIKHWKKWTIFAFLAILVYIGFIFYKYVYQPLYEQKEVSPFKLEIKKSVHQSIMDKFLSREEKINQINNKNYLDPFK
jgi:hypothetical protein